MSRYDRSRGPLLIGCLGVVLAGCATRGTRPAEPAPWLLVHPPEVRDDAYPKGVHLLADAPLAAWPPRGGYPTREDCELARKAQLDTAIERARAEHADGARYELSVRRAVNALCVPPTDPSR
jgi:hypothetical protein